MSTPVTQIGAKMVQGTPSQLVQEMLKRKALDDQVAAYKDTLSHELYDTVLLKGAQNLAKGDYELFSVPVGERSTFATADATAFTKTREHTNLTESRRLSSGRAFSVHGMYANVTITGNPDTGDDEDAAVADPTPVAETGVSAVNLVADLQHLIEFLFSSDETGFESGKLRRFTSPQGISGFAGNSANNTVANNGLGRGYRLPIPRDIWGNRDFGVTMRVHRTVKIIRTCRIEFVLDGFLIRPAR